MAKKETISPFPQAEIDLIFWQYIQGAKDAMGLGPWEKDWQVIRLNQMIDQKLIHIQQHHNGRRPTFDLKAELIMGKIEIKKRLI